jgi:phospholipid/cholesterol/gamma-HCH transport system substrate-binding protein
VNLSRGQKVRLGLFVVSAAGLLLAGVGALLGLTLWQPHITYRTRFTESVNGLERSAPVKYQGLHIGHVEDLHVAADNPRAIEVVLVVDPKTVLFEGTTAVLDGSGLTGLKTINLTPGDIRKPRLKADALLPSGGSLIDKLTDHAAAIVADVRRVADQLAHWASDENRARAESLLSHMDSLIGHLDETLTTEKVPLADAIGRVLHTAESIGAAADEVGKTLKVARGSMEGLSLEATKTLQAVRRPLGDIDPRQVAGTVAALHTALKRLDDRLSGEETGRAIASFGDTMGRMNRLIGDVDIIVRAGREDFTASLSYIRQAAEDLREFSRILAQNPSVLVRGRGDSE